MNNSELVNHRAAAQRQHRLLGLYSSLFCWVNGEEGCLISRETLVALLALQRFKGARVDWLLDDLAVYFGHVKWRMGSGNQFDGLYVCRLTEEEITSRGYDYDDLPLLPLDYTVGTTPFIFASAEHYLVSALSLLGSGAVAPSDVPGFLLNCDDQPD